jgi:hypothetical protein
MEEDFEDVPKVNWKWYRELQEEFLRLTKNFDLEDWSTLRTQEYWLQADSITLPDMKLEAKLKHIRYYYKHGKPLIDDLNL